MHVNLRSAATALLALIVALPAAADVEMSVRTTLSRLATDGTWGEITLSSGGVRQIRVETLSADTLMVTEVIGPLQARPATYVLGDIRAAREIGLFRIPRRIAPYRPPKSVPVALALELVVPGFGYFYAGETRQGYALLGIGSLAAATAALTGEDAAAGWIPFVAWTKIASVAHLRDHVRAANAVHMERAAGLAGAGGRLTLVAARVHF